MSTRSLLGWPPTPSGWPTASRTIEVVEQVFAEWEAEPLLARLAEVGIPAGKVRTIDEVFDWDQTASQGLLVDVDHSVLGPLTLPGPPLRFFEADGTEVTRKDHLAPPTLDEHGDVGACVAAGRTRPGQ